MSNQSPQSTSAELRRLLTQMRGKSPREMLGAIASSNLAQSAITATAAITAAIVLLTLIPFSLTKLFGKSDQHAPITSKAPRSSEPTINTPAEPSLDNASSSPDAANTLGIGGSKSAPSNVNPLESSTDDLLEGLE